MNRFRDLALVSGAPVLAATAARSLDARVSVAGGAARPLAQLPRRDRRGPALSVTDLLEGRAPATRGGRLAAEHIASRLRANGVGAGVKGSSFQTVPIDVVAAEVGTIRVSAAGKASGTLRDREDVQV